ncbi:MAG TPA: hypothetical protein VK172_10320 [Lentimicrobium sp.]|nr:hypothetical protein [Lentimicrobium sp.]
MKDVFVSVYETQKVFKTKVKVSLPEEPYYYKGLDNEYVSLIPQKSGERHSIVITEIRSHRVISTMIFCDERYLAELMAVFGTDGNEMDFLIQRVIEYLIRDYGCRKISEADFYNQLDTFTTGIKNLRYSK